MYNVKHLMQSGEWNLFDWYVVSLYQAYFP